MTSLERPHGNAETSGLPSRRDGNCPVWQPLAVWSIALGALFASAQDAGEEGDPILATLDEAKVAYSSAIEDARKLLLDAYDAEIEKVAKTGDFELVQKLQSERSEFEEEGKTSTTARMRSATSDYQRAIRAATSTLSDAFETAITESTKALQLEQAEAIQQELNDFKENRESLTTASRTKPDAPPTPAEITTKEQLKTFLLGTDWSWETEQVRLKPDGFVENKGWDSRGLVTRWEAIDARTVLFVIEKGRGNDRIAVLRFSDDLTEYNGYDFVAKPLLSMKRKTTSR